MDDLEYAEDGDIDEDVIFYGSPLYSSVMNSGCLAAELKQAELLDHTIHTIEDTMHVPEKGSSVYSGVNNSGCLASDVKETETVNKSEPTRKHVVPEKIRVEPATFSVKNIPTKIYENVVTGLGFSAIPAIHDQNKAAILHSLTKCSCLEEDDAEFLNWYVKKPVTQHSTVGINWTGFDWCLLVVLPAMCAYGYNSTVIPTSWIYTTLSCIVIILLAVCGAIRVASLIYRFRVSRNLQEEQLCVSQYIQSVETLITLLKKCVRLIQETELVARGFTLVSQRGVLLGLEVAGTSCSRQCPGLRRRVFHTCRQAVHHLRDTTRTVLQISSTPDYDIQCNYLAYEPLESYGPCLQGNETEDDDHLYDLTDGFSVSALKGIFHLFTLHQSEFIKGFTVVFDKNSQHLGCGHKPLLSLIGEMQLKLVDWTEPLQSSYDFHSTGLLNKEPCRKAPQLPTQIDDIHVAVHSLDLHLQSALTRVRSLSSTLEKQFGDKDPNTNHFLSHDNLDSMIQPISAELESCRGCWEEGISRIEKFFCKPNNQGADDVCKVQKAGTDQAENKVYTPRAVEDYIIEDQVFEAYTDPSEISYEASSWDEMLTPEQKERKRKEKLEAMKMLSELKNVIKVRAEDTERREQAALMKCRQAEPHSPSDLVHNVIYNDKLSSKQKLMDNPSVCSDPQTSETHDCAISKITEVENHKKDFVDNSEIGNSCSSRTTDKVSSSVMTDPGRHKETVDEDKTVITSYDSKKTPRSYVNFLGVRRLRKSNMLELCDSDSDEAEDTSSDKNASDILEYKKGVRGVSENDLNATPEFQLKVSTDSLDQNKCTADTFECNHNISDKLEHNIRAPDSFSISKQRPDSFEGCNESDTAPSISDEFCLRSAPGTTLEERLSRFPGADLSLASGIAAMAVARSRQMGGMEETTFGGDIFGEKSDSDTDSNGNDGHVDIDEDVHDNDNVVDHANNDHGICDNHNNGDYVDSDYNVSNNDNIDELKDKIPS